MRQEGSVGESKALSGEREKLWGEGRLAAFPFFCSHNIRHIYFDYFYLSTLSIVLSPFSSLLININMIKRS